MPPSRRARVRRRGIGTRSISRATRSPPLAENIPGQPAASTSSILVEPVSPIVPSAFASPTEDLSPSTSSPDSPTTLHTELTTVQRRLESLSAARRIQDSLEVDPSLAYRLLFGDEELSSSTPILQSSAPSSIVDSPRTDYYHSFSSRSQTDNEDLQYPSDSEDLADRTVQPEMEAHHEEPQEPHPPFQPQVIYVQPNQQNPATSMPSSTSASAPKFDSSKPRNLPRYFREVELLLDAAQIFDAQQRKEHTKRYLESHDYEIWDSLPEARAPHSYESFKEAVIDSYPGAESSRKYNLIDAVRLSDKRKQKGISTTSELGEYYRDFRAITTYLVEHNKISEMEQRRMFVKGFPTEFLRRVAHQLSTNHPAIDPDDGYAMGDVYRAAMFLLRGSSFFPEDMYEPHSSYTPVSAARASMSAPLQSQPVAPIAGSTPIKQEDLYSLFGKFAQTIAESVAASISGARPTGAMPMPHSNNSTQGSQPAAQQYRRPPSDGDLCNFCGGNGHFIASCAQAEQYLREGKAIKRPDGRLALPTGLLVPRNIEGQFLKDRMDEWWRRQLGSAADRPPASTPSTSTTGNTSSMFFSVAPSTGQTRTNTSPKASMAMVTADEEDLDSRLEELRRQVLALQDKQKKKKLVFDRVEILKRPISVPKPPVPSTSGTQPLSTRAAEKAPEKQSNPPPSNVASSSRLLGHAPTPTSQAGPSSTAQSKVMPAQGTPGGTSEPPTHPFEKAKDANYLPPVERNFAQPQKAKERDPAYITTAPIQDPKIADIVYKRTLKENHITITFEELLSLSPDLRYRVREAVTPKRQPAAKAPVHYVGDGVEQIEEIISHPALETFKCEPVQVKPGVYQVPDLAQVFYSAQGPDRPVRLLVAKESHALRAIKMDIADKGLVECILDPGSMIVCMSDAVSHQIGIPYNPGISLEMQSANGTLDKTLGLAQNVPFSIDGITFLFQVHVVRSPAYDILLGRPFDVIAQSVIKNYANAEQTVTITDPVTARQWTVPTIERGPPFFTMKRREKAMMEGDFCCASMI